MNAWRLRYRDLREAVGVLLAQLPEAPNAMSMGYGKERGEKYYLRRMSIESVERIRELIE